MEIQMTDTYQPALEVSKAEEDFIRANAPRSGTLAGLWSYYNRKGGLTQRQLDFVRNAMKGA
jgi:hypothetical protein